MRKIVRAFKQSDGWSRTGQQGENMHLKEREGLLMEQGICIF